MIGNVHPVAEVSLIGFVGNPIPADMINLYVKLNEDHVKDHAVTRYVAIKCAVSNNIHEDLIFDVRCRKQLDAPCKCSI
jgi:hypothetical protein